MDIRQFSPQTQRTLAKRDFNQDNKLSARELDLLKSMPEVAGIAPKDLALIQDALKKAKGPETIIVSLVDDDLAPNYKRPEPIYREGGDKSADKAKAAAKGATPARPDAKPEAKTDANPSVKASDKPDAKGKKSRPAIAEPLSFKVTPQMQESESKTPGVKAPGDKDGEAIGVDVQATADLGPLKFTGTTSLGDQGRSLGGKARASFQPTQSLGLELGVDASSGAEPEKAKSSKGDSKPASGKTTGKGSKPQAQTAAPTTAPEGMQLPQQVTLSGRVNAGPIKLDAKGKVDTATTQLTSVSTGAELSLIEGHSLRAEAKSEVDKKNGLNWNAVKLGSSHEVVSGLSLTTSTQLDVTGKPTKYGGGFKLDYGNGLSLEGDALAKADTIARPAQGLKDVDINVGFRYKRSF